MASPLERATAAAATRPRIRFMVGAPAREMCKEDGSPALRLPLPLSLTREGVMSATKTRGFTREFRLIAAAILLASTCVNSAAPAADEWHSLFNGKDLSGWTVKINKHPLGENYADTFRVEDGMIKVSYDRYGKFDM